MQKCRFVVVNTVHTVGKHSTYNCYICRLHGHICRKTFRNLFFVPVRDTLETYNPGLSYIHAVVATSPDKNQLISWNLFKYFIILPSETKNKQKVEQLKKSKIMKTKNFISNNAKTAIAIVTASVVTMMGMTACSAD